MSDAADTGSRLRQEAAVTAVIAMVIVLAASPVRAAPDPPPEAGHPRSGDASSTMVDLVPAQLDGWTPSGPDESYDRDTIFRYMDGAAELYLSFGFRRLLVRRFQGAGPPELTVEVYDMGSAGDAFGIFARNRGGPEAGVGQGSEVVSGYLLFWRDRYFVTIYADSAAAATEPAVLGLGRAISGRIGADGTLPGVIDMLPPDGLIDGSVRYFHLHTDLNTHYFLADANLLDLDFTTNAVLGAYDRGDPPPLVLIVLYPDSGRAATAHGALATMTGAGKAPGAPVRRDDGTCSATARAGAFVVAVFDATDEAVAADLLGGAVRRIKP